MPGPVPAFGERSDRVLVATTVGTNGGHYALLGRNLPRAPVFQIENVAGHPHRLLAASLGRGVYRYRFPHG